MAIFLIVFISSVWIKFRLLDKMDSWDGAVVDDEDVDDGEEDEVAVAAAADVGESSAVDDNGDDGGVNVNFNSVLIPIKI